METKLYGSLAIAATTPLKEFPQLEDQHSTFKGNHTSHRFRGAFSTFALNAAEQAIALPQRGKYMHLTVVSGQPNISSDLILKALAPKVENMDSRFEGSRHLYKLHRILQEVASEHSARTPYVATVNNIHHHPYFAIMSQAVLVYVYGVYDTVNKSIRLVWTTEEDFIPEVRKVDPLRYVFYRFPVMKDRPLFINTSVACANWYQKWSQSFTDVDGVLKSFNALEAFLFKDPSVDVLPVNRSPR